MHFSSPSVVAVQPVPPDVAPRRGRLDLLRVLLGDVAPEDLLEDRPHAARRSRPCRTRRSRFGRSALALGHGARTSSRGRRVNSGQSRATATSAPKPIANAVTTVSRPYTSGRTTIGAGQQHPEQSERDQELPSERHQPVVAHPRQRGADPDVHVDDEQDLQQEPQQRPQPREELRRRPAPSAEPQRRRDRGHGDHVQVLAEVEHRELDARVLGVEPGDELGLGLGQVERRAVRLGEAGDQVDHERRELRDRRSRRGPGSRRSRTSAACPEYMTTATIASAMPTS